jgi:hypothetical protein
MSLSKYTQSAWMIAGEFLAAVSSEDADALREDLLRMGEEGWHAWVAENHAAISGLLSTTPAQRAKRRDWNDPQLRPRIALAAHRQARLGALLLFAAEELQPGGGYRDMCESAARRAHENELAGRWFWPFAGEPPFPYWEPPEDFGL